MEEDKLYCPNCGSSHLTADKKGFGLGKAVTGAVLTGGVGLLAGFIGSGNVKITCLKCGSQWSPGQLRTEPLTPKPEAEKKREEGTTSAAGCLILGGVIIIALLYFAFSL